MRGLLEGRFDEAHGLISQGLATSQGGIDEALMQTLGVQAFVLYGETGRLEEVEQRIVAFVERYTAVPGWRCVLANLHARLGRPAAAQQELERVAADDFRGLSEDLTWLFVVVLLSETCVVLGDAARAARLYELLLPYARRYVVLSAAVCLGSASRYLGLLAGTMGRWDDAVRHLDTAIVMNARIGARPWLAHCQHEHAFLLRNPGEPMKCRDLVAGAAGLLASAETDGVGPVLDAQAKAEYRRLIDLRADLEEAERFNDPERASRMREEIERITDQLAAAVGLGGRDREVASHTERARLLVTQAIKAAIKKIARRHPALAEHLTATIRTGYRCEYRPHPGRPPAWRLCAPAVPDSDPVPLLSVCPTVSRVLHKGPLAETGTGKDLVARAAQARNARA
jgi:hypothetical protein